MENLSIATTEACKPSTKLIREWTDEIKVGIYDNCTWSVRIYADRAIVRMPGVKWEGNTGGYHLYRYRALGRCLRDLLALAQSEIDDDEDYTDSVRETLDMYER